MALVVLFFPVGHVRNHSVNCYAVELGLYGVGKTRWEVERAEQLVTRMELKIV